MSTNNSSTIRARRRFTNTDREFTIRKSCRDAFDIVGATLEQSANVALTTLNATKEALPEVENAVHNMVDTLHNVNVSVRVGNVLWSDMNSDLIKDSGFNEADVLDFSVPSWQVRKVKKTEKKTSSVKKPSRRRSSNKKAVAS